MRHSYSDSFIYFIHNSLSSLNSNQENIPISESSNFIETIMGYVSNTPSLVFVARIVSVFPFINYLHRDRVSEGSLYSLRLEFRWNMTKECMLCMYIYRYRHCKVCAVGKFRQEVVCVAILFRCEACTLVSVN